MQKKKLLMFGLPLICLAVVSAVIISHYGLFEQEFNVTQPMEVTGDTSQSIDCLSGEICPGSSIEISNSAPFSVNLIILASGDEGIKTSYVSELELTKKTVDFSQDVWEIPEGAEKVKIQYTLVGDEFSAEVIENEKEGYELIYYKDNSDRFNSPAQAIKISEISGNLPYEDDKNSDEYDYCETGEYQTCFGSKIWYLPSDAISGGDIDWSRADEFYFETALIQYNSDGQITIYGESDLEITPIYELNSSLGSGNYIITTEINPTD